MALPTKTTAEDLEMVLGYLRTQVGWISIKKMSSSIPEKHAHAFKLEAMRYLGLIERNESAEVKLSDTGRTYAEAKNPTQKAEVIAGRLKTVPLFEATLAWIHYNQKEAPTKTDVANYWHDKHASATGGASGDALTDPVIFFFRMADLAGFGKFIPAGKGRDSHFKVNLGALKPFVTGQVPARPAPADAGAPVTAAPAAPAVATPSVSMADRVHINVEIHIAADAKPSTIEEIFKNMRRYLLEQTSPNAG
jgi:hypothetical protein